MHLKTAATGAFALVMFALTGQMSAQSAPPSQPPSQKPAAPVNGTTAPAAAPAVPVDYVIGPDDVLAIMVREDKEMTGERRPLQLGFHFTMMNGGAYWRALERFAAEACIRPDVACITYSDYLGRTGTATVDGDVGG